MKSCYIILFSNNVVKVGISENLPERVKQHKNDASGHNIKIKRIWAFMSVTNAEELEKKLISDFSNSFERNKTEYFNDCDEVYCDFYAKSLGVGFVKCLNIIRMKNGNIAIEVQDQWSSNKNTLNPIQVSIVKHKEKIRKRVITTIKNNGPTTEGVLVNRCRPYEKTEVENQIKEMLSFGILVEKKKKNDANKKEYSVYDLS